jgi:purine-nucleoside phosphorylase
MSHPAVQVAERLADQFGAAPSLAFVLGSGAAPVAKALTKIEGRVPYEQLGLPVTGVEGHSGEAIVGHLGANRVLVLSGRVHAYEGWTGEELVRGVRALAHWGGRNLVLTSAVGSLRKDLPAGSLVRITDHINMLGNNPLRGPGLAWPGARFPDMSEVYSHKLGALLEQAAALVGVNLHAGVYAAMPGPSYETPAEVRMLRAMGGDVVGMSVVLEAIAAVQAGLTLGTVSVVANLGSGLSPTPLTHEEVTLEVGKASAGLVRVLSAIELSAQ